MMVDEFDGDEYELRAVVDAAQTMPFLTDKRVVVARDIGRFNADDLPALLGYLDNPARPTELVLVGGGGPDVEEGDRRGQGSRQDHRQPAPPKKAGDRGTWIRDRSRMPASRLEPRAGSASPSGWVRSRRVSTACSARCAVHSARASRCPSSRHRTVPRRGGRCAAVGLHRRDRRWRHDQGADADGTHDPRRQAAPTPDHGDPARPLRRARPTGRCRTPGASRKRRRQRAQAGSRPRRRLQNYSRLGGPRRSGRSNCSPRPTSTCVATRISMPRVVMEVLVARLSKLR